MLVTNLRTKNDKNLINKMTNQQAMKNENVMKKILKSKSQTNINNNKIYIFFQAIYS